MIKILIQTIYYQLIISLRIKKSVFFTIVFPIFLFIIFGVLWGGQKEYISFLLSGIIGMILASEGLFAIGPVIKIYYSNGLIKYLRKMPFNILLYFSGLIISRLIIVSFSVAMLCITAKLIFGFTVSSYNVLNYILGTFLGIYIFSFIGLDIAFWGIRKDAFSDLSTNFVLFVILFTSNAFYPVGDFSKAIYFIGNILPLNPVLSILRDNSFNLSLLFWLIVPSLIFYFLFNKINLSRI